VGLGGAYAGSVADEVASAGLNLPGSGQLSGFSGTPWLLYELFELEAAECSGESSFFAENVVHELKTSINAVPAEIDAKTR